MFEQGLRRFFYHILKNAFRSLHRTFKAACVTFTVKAQAAMSGDLWDVSVTDPTD